MRARKKFIVRAGAREKKISKINFMREAQGDRSPVVFGGGDVPPLFFSCALGATCVFLALLAA
jgi:hypothetical protein